MKIVGFKVKRNKVKAIHITQSQLTAKITILILLNNGLTQEVYAGNISDAMQPLIQIFKDLAEPVAYAFMIKGFLKLMSGDEHEGFKTIKYAIGGYIGIQWIPFIFQTIKSVKF